jgi:hypothetical protein
VTDKFNAWIVVRLRNGQMKEAVEERVIVMSAHVPNLTTIIIIIIIIIIG